MFDVEARGHPVLLCIPSALDDSIDGFVWA